MSEVSEDNFMDDFEKGQLNPDDFVAGIEGEDGDEILRENLEYDQMLEENGENITDTDE